MSKAYSDKGQFKEEANKHIAEITCKRCLKKMTKMNLDGSVIL